MIVDIVGRPFTPGVQVAYATRRGFKIGKLKCVEIWPHGIVLKVRLRHTTVAIHRYDRVLVIVEPIEKAPQTTAPGVNGGVHERV